MNVPTDVLEADVYTVSQRVFGLIHPTAGAAVAEFLNRNDRAMLPVTNALVFDPDARNPLADCDQVAVASFYAVPKEQILWIRSGYFETQTPLEYDTQRISVYFDGYSISGSLRMPRNSRLSDHLERSINQKPFQRLHQATVAPSVPGTPGVKPGNQRVFASNQVLSVNLRQARGIAELSENPHQTVELSGREFRADGPKQLK